MDIRAASAEDYTFLLENDRHIRPGELRLSLEQGRVLLIRRGAERIGCRNLRGNNGDDYRNGRRRQ